MTYLRHHIELLPKNCPGLAVYTVGMASRVHIRPSLVDLAMYRKGRCIDHLLVAAVSYLPILIYQNKV